MRVHALARTRRIYIERLTKHIQCINYTPNTQYSQKVIIL